MLVLPVKKTVWGNINSLDDFKKAVAKSGQWFGEDKSGPACNFDPALPCDQTFYQALGLGAHNGIDIPTGRGLEILSAGNGVVHELVDDVKAGKGVVVWHRDLKLKTYYWHLLSFSVVLKQEVKKGDILGLSDSTGYSTGDHLHFGLKQTDQFGNTINYGNGMNGAIDPMPYLVFDDMKFELRQVAGSKDVFIVRNGKKTLVYNAGALTTVADFSDIQPITQAELNAIPDSGLELASLVKE